MKTITAELAVKRTGIECNKTQMDIRKIVSWNCRSLRYFKKHTKDHRSHIGSFVSWETLILMDPYEHSLLRDATIMTSRNRNRNTNRKLGYKIGAQLPSWCVVLFRSIFSKTTIFNTFSNVKFCGKKKQQQ